MKPFLTVMNFLSGLVLIRFTISKLAAWPISVAAFVDMAKPIGIDPTFFRISTGFIIGYASIAFFTNSLITLLNKKGNEKLNLLFTFNSLYTTGAMTGALIAEFFLRSTPKWPLVYIAIVMVIVSAFNLFSRNSKVPELLKGNGSDAAFEPQASV